jgi:hypothetical protein
MDLISFSGSGFQYIQQQLLRSVGGESDPSMSEKTHADDRGPCLSETAKHLMLQLLKDENIRLSDYPNGTLSKSCRRKGAQSDMKIIDPAIMSDEYILDLAYKNEISLFGSILFILEQYLTKGDPTAPSTTSNTSSVPTKYILQKCAYAVPPHQTPGLLSAQDMILMALHFLCQEYSPSTRWGDSKYEKDVLSELRFPLLYTTSAMGDLERRNYVKAYDWKIDAILPQVLEFEQDFYNSILDDCVTADADRSDAVPRYYHWLPREKFCPNISINDTLRRTLLLQGQNPASTNNSKGKAKTTKPVKRKRQLALESEEPTSGQRMKGFDDDSTQSEGDDVAVETSNEDATEE